MNSLPTGTLITVDKNTSTRIKSLPYPNSSCLKLFVDLKISLSLLHLEVFVDLDVCLVLDLQVEQLDPHLLQLGSIRDHLDCKARVRTRGQTGDFTPSGMFSPLAVLSRWVTPSSTRYFVSSAAILLPINRLGTTSSILLCSFLLSAKTLAASIASHSSEVKGGGWNLPESLVTASTMYLGAKNLGWYTSSCFGGFVSSRRATSSCTVDMIIVNLQLRSFRD